MSTGPVLENETVAFRAYTAARPRPKPDGQTDARGVRW